MVFSHTPHGFGVLAYLLAILFLIMSTGCAVKPTLVERSAENQSHIDRDENHSNEVTFQLGLDAAHRGRFNSAVRAWKPLVNQGYPAALNAMGLSYQTGRGVDKNLAKSLRYYRRAAEQGLPEAMNNLAVLYEGGEGITQDLSLAAKYYRRAAELGNVSAQYNIGRLLQAGKGVEKDTEEAFFWYRKAEPSS